MGSSKGPMYVLCHTVFHNAFRSGQFKDSDGIEPFLAWLRARFISDFIIETDSELHERDYCAITSKKIFDELESKIEADGYSPKEQDSLAILKNSILCVDDERINELGNEEGIIIIADTLSNRGNYETIVISEMKDKNYQRALDFYKEQLGEDNPTIPFMIKTTGETLEYLRHKFSETYENVKKRDSKYGILD